MSFKIGDVIKNKLKDGPHFLITEIRNDTVVCLQLEGPEDGKYAYFSLEDMWVFEKV